MHLIEIFLPLADNDGKPFADAKFSEVRETLTKAFGGVTAFTRSPAEGEVREERGVIRDDIVVFEVMAPKLDRERWATYRKLLEGAFDQDDILIRATVIERL